MSGVDCPALHERFPDKGYPFGNRVPKTIRMHMTVYPDFPSRLDDPTPAKAAQVYPAWTNSYGAVAAVLPSGRTMGVVPGEYEVLTWTEVAS